MQADLPGSGPTALDRGTVPREDNAGVQQLDPLDRREVVAEMVDFASVVGDER
jgi:hypothetical protein